MVGGRGGGERRRRADYFIQQENNDEMRVGGRRRIEALSGVSLFSSSLFYSSAFQELERSAKEEEEGRVKRGNSQEFCPLTASR
ncbi:uncharacterized [Tachysurus ichikawai]